MAQFQVHSSDKDTEVTIHGLTAEEFNKWTVLSNSKAINLTSGKYIQFKISDTEITLFSKRED